MRKLILIAIAVASYYIAGMYRQMPLMILAVMEWILLVFLFFFPRCLRKKMTLSFPAQSSEAEKGSEKKCMLRIERTGIFPIKKVCVRLNVYDNQGTLLQKGKIHKTMDALSGTIDLGIACTHCGILTVRIYKVYVYDYLSAFSAAKTMNDEMKLVVLPKARALPMMPFSVEAAANRQEELQPSSGAGRFGDESKEIRQIREYRVGDTMRYVHWNQSAKTGKLWFKEFEREEESAFEILLDMMLPEHWKREERDGFYEVVSALALGLLKLGYHINIRWYDKKADSFVIMPIENRTDYRRMMRRLYQSEFVEKMEAVEQKYKKEQMFSDGRLLKCNLLLECFVITDSCKEELRHRFTYENLEKELSGDFIFLMR